MKPELRRPLVAGNWKLHKTLAESAELAKGVAAGTGADGVAEVVVAPVATALSTVAGALKGSAVGLSAQNTHWESQGAFTGELSPALLKDVGCGYIIVGHSERRQLFGETDAGVNRKARAVLEAGMTPILCVGETLAQREAGAARDTVAGQVKAGLEGMETGELSRLVLAYEPVWAIGTGKTASPQDAQEIHGLIRTLLVEIGGQAVADGCRVLYGGSVKPDNAAELLAENDIDGALVGGASLKVDTFLAIVGAAG